MNNYEINKISFSEGIKLFPKETQEQIKHDIKNIGRPLAIYFDKNNPEQKYLISESDENHYNTHNINNQSGLQYGHYDFNSFEKAENDIGFKINLQNGYDNNNFKTTITDISTKKSINDFTLDEKISILLDLKTPEYFPKLQEYWKQRHPRYKEHDYAVQPYFIEKIMEQNPNEFNLKNESIDKILKSKKLFLDNLIKNEFKNSTEEETISQNLKILIKYKNQPDTKIETGITSYEEASNFTNFKKDYNVSDYSVIFDLTNDKPQIIESTDKYKQTTKIIEFLDEENNITDNIPYFKDFENKKEVQNKLDFMFNNMKENKFIPAYNNKDNNFLIFDMNNKTIQNNLNPNQLLTKGIEIIKNDVKTKEKRNNIKTLTELNKIDLSQKNINETKKIKKLKEELKDYKLKLKNAENKIKENQDFTKTIEKIKTRDKEIFQDYNLAEIFKGLNHDEINECWMKTKIYADSIRNSKKETKSNINQNEKNENTGNSRKGSR